MSRLFIILGFLTVMSFYGKCQGYNSTTSSSTDILGNPVYNTTYYPE